MSKERSFRFGVTLLGASSRQEWIAKVRRVEELGYSSLDLPDHLGERFFPPLIALTLAAEASRTLRLGTKVLDNNFRHLALMAKEMATLDLFSGGRVEIGLGAGFLETESRQVGIPFDAPGVRVGRLEEAVRLLKSLYADGPVTFSGRYYTMNGFELFPKPLQRPHPPILLAGGSKRTLSLAAREADIVNLNPRVLPGGNSPDLQDASAEATAQKVALIREVAGERFAEIELATELFAVVRNDRVQESGVLNTENPVEARNNLGRPPQGPYVLAGSVDQICEQALANREQLGISYISVMEKDAEAFAPVVQRLRGQ
jgi:probable F420-dependent oxidoreductase